MKLLLIGRPGSGKTLAAHLLIAMAQEQGYHALHIDDYPILCKMYHEEGERTERFQTLLPSGFDVLNYTVLDEVLQEMEQQIQGYDVETLVIIELARDDYQHAFSQFSQGFLRNTMCLCIDADLETCIKRVRARLADGTGHPSCSEPRRRAYYAQQLLPAALPLEIIDNNGTQEAFEEQVRQFASTYLRSSEIIGVTG